MKKMLLCALLFVLPGSLWAATSLWEVRSGGSLAYLGGTCHVLRPADYPLPAEFGRAYNAVQAVVFEADPGQMNTPEVQQMIMAGAIYQDAELLPTYCLLRPITSLKAIARVAILRLTT